MNRSGIDDSRSTSTDWWGNHSLLGAKVTGRSGLRGPCSPMSADNLFLIGPRIVNIEKAFNTNYARFSRADDMPPKIFVDEPIKSRRHKGGRLDESKWNEMLDEFYESHGWAKETVEQTRDSLLRLDLGDVWQILEEHNGT